MYKLMFKKVHLSSVYQRPKKWKEEKKHFLEIIGYS